jgi:hypothetical protein
MNVTLVASVPAGTGPPLWAVLVVVPPVVVGDVPVDTVSGVLAVGVEAVVEWLWVEPPHPLSANTAARPADVMPHELVRLIAGRVSHPPRRA